MIKTSMKMGKNETGLEIAQKVGAIRQLLRSIGRLILDEEVKNVLPSKFSNEIRNVLVRGIDDNCDEIMCELHKFNALIEGLKF